jgi:hypothetical protein
VRFTQFLDLIGSVASSAAAPCAAAPLGFADVSFGHAGTQGAGAPHAGVVAGVTMRKQQTGSQPINRRHLLKGAGFAAGAAAASSAVAAEGPAKDAVGSDGERRARSSGLYRETADVKSYYKSARY